MTSSPAVFQTEHVWTCVTKHLKLHSVHLFNLWPTTFAQSHVRRRTHMKFYVGHVSSDLPSACTSTDRNRSQGVGTKNKRSSELRGAVSGSHA